MASPSLSKEHGSAMGIIVNCRAPSDRERPPGKNLAACDARNHENSGWPRLQCKFQQKDILRVCHTVSSCHQECPRSGRFSCMWAHHGITREVDGLAPSAKHIVQGASCRVSDCPRSMDGLWNHGELARPQ